MSTRVYSSAGLSVCFRDDGRWLLQSDGCLEKVEGGCEDGKGLEAANSSYDVSSSSGSIYSSLALLAPQACLLQQSSDFLEFGRERHRAGLRRTLLSAPCTLLWGAAMVRQEEEGLVVATFLSTYQVEISGASTGQSYWMIERGRGPAVNRGKTKRRRDDGRIEWRHNVMPDCPITTQRTKLNIYRGLWADNVDQKGALGSCQRDRMDRTNSTPIKIGL
ncbi:hypothetical protein KCU80_g20, partial [Aureobasidium melanogenum]